MNFWMSDKRGSMQKDMPSQHICCNVGIHNGRRYVQYFGCNNCGTGILGSLILGAYKLAPTLGLTIPDAILTCGLGTISTCACVTGCVGICLGYCCMKDSEEINAEILQRQEKVVTTAEIASETANSVLTSQQGVKKDVVVLKDKYGQLKTQFSQHQATIAVHQEQISDAQGKLLDLQNDNISSDSSDGEREQRTQAAAEILAQLRKKS